MVQKDQLREFAKSFFLATWVFADHITLDTEESGT